jgi:type VI secretion system protein ImpL
MWRNDASGAAVGGSVTMLRQFEAADRIRTMFFRPGSQDVDVRFSIAPYELDAAVNAFTIDLDGQSSVYRHGPVSVKPATWPGPKPGMAVVTFEERAGGARPNIAAEGAWAWFRLIDSAQVTRETDTTYVLTFEKGGHQARVRVEAVSIRNPYGKQTLQQFRCG